MMLIEYSIERRIGTMMEIMMAIKMMDIEIMDVDNGGWNNDRLIDSIDQWHDNIG